MYFSQEQIRELKKIDLLTYLQNYEPNELVHISGNNYCTRTHDSLKISNGLWNWFSKGIGGKNAIDYLIKVKNYTFIEELQLLANCNIKNISFSVSSNKEKKKSNIVIPSKSNSFIKAKEYLINRGIAEEIVDECEKNNLIYQEEKTDNVVFVGYDNCKNIRYAGCRATNGTRYMRDATGSDKKYSFRLLSNEPNNSIHVFESSIDLLSYATLLDRDIPGRNAAKAFKIVIPKEYIVIDCPAPYGKDINDFLCHKLGIKRTNEITNTNKIKEQYRE